METLIIVVVLGLMAWIFSIIAANDTTDTSHVDLDFAREHVRHVWDVTECLAHGEASPAIELLGETKTASLREDILAIGVKSAFLYQLAMYHDVVPNKKHRYNIAEQHVKGQHKQCEHLIFEYMGNHYKEALTLESKSGDFGDISASDTDMDDISRVLLGVNKEGDPIFHTGEGHLITVAPTGAGKGQCHILPNLFDYNGSVFVLDVKGENERLTGLHRFRYGNSFTFAPYAKTTDHYNPLDFVKSWSECREMAEWLMVPTSKGGDDYFQNRGREFLAALVYFVVTTYPQKARTMRTVCKLVWGGADALENTWQVMEKTGDDMLEESAQDMRSTFKNAPKEFSGIINSAKASLEIWREPEIAEATSHTEEGWTPASLRNEPAIKEAIVKNGGCEGMSAEKLEELKDKLGMSVFLNVPVGKIKQMSSLLRVFIGQHIRAIMQASDDPDLLYGHGQAHEGLPTAPVMFMLDEFPQLGFMKVIEETLEIGRSYKIKLWLFAQDMGQLARYYPNPKGIIANCTVQSFMNINDNETAKYVSERLGTVRPIMGEKRPLADLPMLMGEDFKEDFICLKRNQKPLKLTKLYAYKTERFAAYMTGAKDFQNQLADTAKSTAAE